jgi:metal-responsive CopG/Arc/MetJ family transcriptional regulator
MKTSISIPNDLFQSADALAEQMGMSRSELYAIAVSEYVAKHRATDVTARLNEVYAAERTGLPESVTRAQARSVRLAEW